MIASTSDLRVPAPRASGTTRRLSGFTSIPFAAPRIAFGASPKEKAVTEQVFRLAGEGFGVIAIVFGMTADSFDASPMRQAVSAKAIDDRAMAFGEWPIGYGQTAMGSGEPPIGSEETAIGCGQAPITLASCR